jgi:hypothetical protein
MSTMQFDESQFKLRSRKILGEPEIPGMIRFLVTKGLVKGEKQAIAVILGIVIVIVVISVVVVRSSGTRPVVIDPEYVNYNSK